MATLINKRKLAAVSRETPEGSRSSRVQNVLDPESAQDYISQVSEEIEGRVTKKLSKEFSKTESRFLGALSKLDGLLLNSQVRTCSVAVPDRSGTVTQETGRPLGIAPQTIPTPKWGSLLITLVNSSTQRQRPTPTVTIINQSGATILRFTAPPILNIILQYHFFYSGASFSGLKSSALLLPSFQGTNARQFLCGRHSKLSCNRNFEKPGLHEVRQKLVIFFRTSETVHQPQFPLILPRFPCWALGR